MRVKALRGAIQLTQDNPETIREGVKRLVSAVLEQNGLSEEDIISLQFTVTRDLRSLNPAAALRQAGPPLPGFRQVPLFCSQEPDCHGALPLMIRLLLTGQTERNALQPVYLDGARALRPDLEQQSGPE